jgi:hypothetical protein
MTTWQFMASLEKLGVVFDWVDGEMVIEAPPGALWDAQRDELTRRYDEVEQLVRVALGPYEPVVRVTEASPVQATFGEAA